MAIILKVIEVKSLEPEPDMGEEIDDGDEDPDTRTFVVAAAETGVVTVNATPNPDVADAMLLPDSWTLTGGSGAGKLSRTIDRTTPGIYTLTCTCGTSEKKTKVIVFKAELAFQTSGMASPKVIPYLEYQRIGVLQSDSIMFSAMLTPNITLPKDDYAWSGEKAGNGSLISVPFNTLGTSRTETLQIFSCTKTATISVVEVPPPDQTTWAIMMTALHGATWVLKINTLADEALEWAQATLGGSFSLHNGQADAARHAYWNALMRVEGYSPADAWGAGQSHERTNIVDGGAHNESVMDLENNQTGITIGGGLTTYEAAQAAVITALYAGNLTYLDDLTNSGERGLLQPTNK